MTILANFLRQWEGCRLTAYRDEGGVLTVGVGHTGPDVIEGMTITQAQADALLAEDTKWALDAVRDTVKVPLDQYQEAALASLVFNIGPGKDGWRGSTALRRLNAGDYAGCAEAMTWWNKAKKSKYGNKPHPGLVRRREAERALFLANAHAGATDAPGGQVTGGEAKPATKSKTQWLGLSGVLTAILGAWAQIRENAPELHEWLLPYLPYIFGVIFLAVMFNRWWDSRRGVH